MEWHEALITRSNSSDLHLGHLSSICSSWFLNKNSKQSLHFKHLNSYIGMLGFLYLEIF